MPPALQLLMALNHPNIVRCTECFIHANKLCIVMDWCSEGRSRLGTPGSMAQLHGCLHRGRGHVPGMWRGTAWRPGGMHGLGGWDGRHGVGMQAAWVPPRR